jgi:nucleoredoxin
MHLRESPRATTTTTTGVTTSTVIGETTPKIHNRKPELVALPSHVIPYADECFLDNRRREGKKNGKINGKSGPRRRFRRNQPLTVYVRRLIQWGAMLICAFVVWRFSGSSKTKVVQEERSLVDRTATETLDRKPTNDYNAEQHRMSLLDEFPSLQVPLDTSDIVALYFAASWCPMSTPTTKLLDKLFRDLLVDTADEERHELTIVYISSDEDVASFRSYVKPGWEAVPFENSNERSALKRHFGTCAKREMDEAGLTTETRKFEIPNLIVLSGSTRQVLTYSGLEDIKELGDDALAHWMDLNRLDAASAISSDATEE